VRYLISTGVPTGTRRYSWITSATRMRMQPWDARVPIEYSCPVPWMPTEPDTPIQRAFRDVHAVANHGANNWDLQAVPYAREVLGLPPLPAR